jgi:hypothetical protein
MRFYKWLLDKKKMCTSGALTWTKASEESQNTCILTWFSATSPAVETLCVCSAPLFQMDSMAVSR